MKNTFLVCMALMMIAMLGCENERFFCNLVEKLTLGLFSMQISEMGR